MAGPTQPSVARALAPLLDDPATTAVITDFDGTLAPIVADPAEARPLPGAVDAMARLARRFGVVAVVSGRSASFLQDRLATAQPGAEGGTEGLSSVRLVGLYGLERSAPEGDVTVEPGAERWRHVIADATERIRAAAPRDVEVEHKGLAVTVHWRQAPDEADWVARTVGAEAARTGLEPHPGRLSIELRPPTGIDKGWAIRRLVAGCTAACYLGDDLGDLPAFAALAELATTTGLMGVCVAATDEESPPEVAEAADVTVDGPRGALAVLDWLASADATGRSVRRRPPADR